MLPAHHTLLTRRQGLLCFPARHPLGLFRFWYVDPTSRLLFPSSFGMRTERGPDAAVFGTNGWNGKGRRKGEVEMNKEMWEACAPRNARGKEACQDGSRTACEAAARSSLGLGRTRSQKERRLAICACMVAWVCLRIPSVSPSPCRHLSFAASSRILDQGTSCSPRR